MQIERDILNQPAKLADLLQTPLEKALIIRLKAQITLLTQDFIVYFQICTPRQAALALTIRRPRIGKIQVNAVHLDVYKRQGLRGHAHRDLSGV